MDLDEEKCWCLLDVSAYKTLERMFVVALKLQGPFEMNVIKPLTTACSHVDIWVNCCFLPCTDNVDIAIEDLAMEANIKGVERAREKLLKEYNGDLRHLKDILRCSILCNGLGEIQAVWMELVLLHKNGILVIVQIKNRFRGEPLSGGYRDININVVFHGFVCEIQIHSVSHFKLKKHLHPIYRFCRSYNLVGDLDDRTMKYVENKKKRTPLTTILGASL